MTLETAMIFEKSFQRQKAQKKLLKLINKSTKASLMGNDDASKIKQVILKRYGENSRHSSKFIEIASQM